MITARYSDLHKEPAVEVTFKRGDETQVLRIRPADPETVSSWRV